VNPQGTYYSSVWGYTDVNGREYAILGCYNGTAIVDLNYLPGSLPEVAFIPGPTATYSYREFKTYLQYLYIVSEGGSGVQIVDLSGLPNSVQVLSSYTVIDRAHTISESSGFLYLNGGTATLGSANVGGTRIVSLANPGVPQSVGVFGNHYVHDAYTRNDTMFAAGIFGIGLSILDVRNKSNPQLLKTITYPGSGTHNSWVTENGAYALTTDEIGNTAKTLKIWDIRDLENITNIAEWNPRPGETIHNVVGKGNYAYCAFYKAGILIADITDPLNPTLAGSYDTFPDTVQAIFDGAWGVYPLLPSGKILVSDMTYGLFVFSFDDQEIGTVSGLITDSQTGLPLVNALIRIKETGQTRWTNAQGEFFWGYAAGTYTLTVERAGAIPATVIATVQDGVNSTVQVSLTIPPALPVRYELHQNFPNPCNPGTTIAFDVPLAGRVTIRVFDLLGRNILTIVDRDYPPGRFTVDVEAGGLHSGLYVYRIETPNYVSAKKMSVIR
jgi:choice-of-anchor B domain-containing protein